MTRSTEVRASCVSAIPNASRVCASSLIQRAQQLVSHGGVVQSPQACTGRCGRVGPQRTGSCTLCVPRVHSPLSVPVRCCAVLLSRSRLILFERFCVGVGAEPHRHRARCGLGSALREAAAAVGECPITGVRSMCAALWRRRRDPQASPPAPAAALSTVRRTRTVSSASPSPCHSTRTAPSPPHSLWPHTSPAARTEPLDA